MAGRWQLLEMNHINAIVDHYAGTVAHLRDRLGFALDREMPDWDASTDACLMIFGDTMIELFAPKPGGAGLYGERLRQSGVHHNGIQYQVTDLAEARAVVADQGMRITNDLGVAFFVDDSTTFGVEWEVYDRVMARQPPAGYWLDEHPMALYGCDHVTVSVHDADAATARLQTLTDATVVGPVTHALAAAQGVRLHVGSIDWEIVQPTGPGPAADQLDRAGEGIRSTVWKTSDLGKVERYLRDRGFDPVAGDAAGTLAIPPAQNKGLLFEFTE
jgi:hypothetical protein